MASWATTTTIIRIVQVVSGLISFGALVEYLSSGYVFSSQPLMLSAAWASAVSSILAVLNLIFCREQIKEVALSATFDALGLTCLVSAVICVLVNGTLGYGWMPQYVIAVVGACAGAVAYIITLVRTILLYRKHTAKIRSTDPLKPYLMKKEIDVWCYPVQNEQGQLFMDYEPVSSSGASKPSSAAQSMRARSVKSFVRIDEQAPQSSRSRPESSVETTAGWSVPSQNETLQRSLAASTALPSYRSPSRNT